MIAWTVACAFGGRGPRPKIQDFMPDWDQQPMEPAQVEMLVKMYAKQLPKKKAKK